jgi:hypothetical protein
MAPRESTTNKKNPRTEMTSAAGKCLRKMDLPLARCEPSPPYRLREPLRLAGRCPIALQKPYPDCPLGAEATRARFEFVGRTHREKTHSWGSVKLPLHLRLPPTEAIALPFGRRSCSDKPGLFQSQAKNDLASDFFELFLGRWAFLGGEDHVSRFLAEATAFFDVKTEIVLQNVVPPRVAKFSSGPVNGCGRSFQFDKRTDGRFIQLDQQFLCPAQPGGQAKRGTVFFVAEPSAHS